MPNGKHHEDFESSHPVKAGFSFTSTAPWRIDENCLQTSVVVADLDCTVTLSTENR